jgi:hypothetical protein
VLLLLKRNKRPVALDSGEDDCILTEPQISQVCNPTQGSAGSSSGQGEHQNPASPIHDLQPLLEAPGADDDSGEDLDSDVEYMMTVEKIQRLWS